MTLEELIKEVASWLDGSGLMSSIVLSSRVRLARNLRAYPFTNRSRDEELNEVLDQFRLATRESKFLRGGLLINIGQLSDLDRGFLMERHLISPDLAKGKKSRGLYVGDHEVVSVMVNEEDHIRLQAMQSGLQLRDTWEIIDRIDEMGGIVAAVEAGFPQREIAHSAYEFQRRVEREEEIIVGINRYRQEGDAASKIPTLKIEATTEREQVERVKAVRAARDATGAAAALQAVRDACDTGGNLMPVLLAAGRAGCTLGEICGVYREAFGEYRDPGGY